MTRRVKRYLAICLPLLLISPAAFYVFLAAGHAREMSWTLLDNDGDGIALIDDLDSDGDGVSFPEDTDADNDGVPNEKEAAAYAQTMAGIPTDFLMGKFNDILGRIGRIVCVDVPIRSWLAAGASFPALLKQSAREHPEWFEIGPENSPANKFFYRRVRNYHDLFTHHPGLETSNAPRVGDWAFYGRHHTALVIAVNDKGGYRVMEAYWRWRSTAEAEGIDLEKFWGKPDFFGRVKTASP